MSRRPATLLLFALLWIGLAGRPEVSAEPPSVPTPAAEIPSPRGKVELFVGDADASIAFYRHLDFEVVHAKEGGYTTLRRGGFVLALSPLPTWLPVSWFGFLRSPPLGTELVFYVTDLGERRARLEAEGHAPGAIALQPWGDRDFRVDDPDGYYVRVSEGASVPASTPEPPTPR